MLESGCTVYLIYSDEQQFSYSYFLLFCNQNVDSQSQQFVMGGGSEIFQLQRVAWVDLQGVHCAG
jgi:hypothetical protein